MEDWKKIMRRLLYLFFLFLVLSFPGNAVHAESHENEKEDVTVLETIVVTDTLKNKLVDIPSSITVLTEKDIENSGQTNLADLVSTIPGVINQKAGSRTYLSIRGTRGVLSEGAVIYVDGKPINSGQYGYSKIDTVPLDNVVKIEVIKSPSPSVYGANASRGVILITTRSGRDASKPLQSMVSGEIGSWGTQKGTANLSGIVKKFDYSLTAHAMKRDGYRESDEEVKSLDGQSSYLFDDGHVDLLIGLNDSFLKNPAGLPLYAAKSDRTQPGYNTKADGSGYYVLPSENDCKTLNSGLKFNHEKNGWLQNHSLIFTHTDETNTDKDDYNSPDNNARRDDPKDDRDEDRFDAKVNFGKIISGKNLTDNISVGIDCQVSAFSQVRNYPLNSDVMTASMSTGKKKADVDIDSSISAVNVNNELAFEKAKLTTGLRVNHAEYEIKNKIPASFDKDYEGDLDWSISPSYSIVENGNVFVSFNHSNWYLPVGLYRLDMEYSHPDALAENLEPEIYDTLETGFKHCLSKAFNYSVICYHTTVSDKIISFYDGTSFKGYRNAGTSIHQGVELEVDGRPSELIGYRLSFTTINAEWDKGVAKSYLKPDSAITSVVDLSGKEVNYVPEYEYSVGFDFYLLQESASGALTASLDIHGFGKQYEDYCNNLEMSPADFVDLKLTWSFKSYKLYIAGVNIFDREWDKYSNSTGVSHARIDGGMGGIYPQDGRYVSVGGSYNF